jgi:Protein of unknown function (DUF3465)
MNKKHLNKIIIAFILSLAVLIFGLKNRDRNVEPIVPLTPKHKEVVLNPNAEVINAIKKSLTLKYISVKNAKVIRNLPDDKNGPLHQRWIMEIDNGLTITVFHNVDIAERVPLTVGDYVSVTGELEYGDKWKDPIMHWTHDDPQGQRKAGFVTHNGQTYGPATGP